MGTETQLVKVEHLYKEFDADTKVLSDINLTINKNEVIAILGPSGTGKFCGSTAGICTDYFFIGAAWRFARLFSGAWHDAANFGFTDTGTDTQCSGQHFSCDWLHFPSRDGIRYDQSCIWRGRKRSWYKRRCAWSAAVYGWRLST